MKYIIDDKIVLSRAPEGPFAAYLIPFASSLKEQGYSLQSVHKQVLLAACFSQWLRQKNIPLRSITSDLPARYLRYRAQQVVPNLGDVAALRHLLAFLRREGVIPTERVRIAQLTPAERWTRAYEHHLREARGLAEATIVNYVPFVRKFLNGRFGNRPVALSRLCASDVVRFVQLQAPRLHRKRAQLLTSALRSFLRYARCRGEVKLDLELPSQVWPTGQCHRSRERLRQIKSAECSPALIAEPPSGVEITPFCSSSRDWVYGQVRWRPLSSMTLTGAGGNFPFMGRVANEASYHCPWTLAK